jgi:hypothetical protein
VRWIFAGCLVAIVLSLGAGTPVYRILYDHILIFQITRVPARWLELWAFGAALLCGYSFDALLKNPRQACLMQKVWVGATALCGALLAFSALARTPWQEAANAAHITFRFPLERLPELASSLQSDAIVSCILAGATLLLLVRVWGRGLVRNSSVALVMGLLAAEPLMQFWLSTTITPVEVVQQSQVPSLIARRYESGQRWIARTSFGQLNAPFMAGIDTINGYEPFGSAQFFEFARAVDARTDFSADFQLRRMEPLWRVAGASQLLWKARFEGDNPRHFPGVETAIVGKWHLRELHDGLKPWPRAYLTAEVFEATENIRYEVLERQSKKPYGNSPPVVVEPDFPAVRKGASTMMKVTSRQTTTDLLEWDIDTPQAAVFVHQEAIAPGWRAYVDGRPAALHRVNGFFRGVFVPEGSRRVALVYNAETVRFALFAALCGLGYAVVAFTAARKRNQRSRP